mgnify:CR=1 FL=1
MDYDKIFRSAIERLHDEGRYRVFIDILRTKGRIIAELVSAPQDLVDPVTGSPVDSRPDWIGDAVLDAQRLTQIQPAADDTVVGMTDRTLERVQDAERALGSPDPAAAAKSAAAALVSNVDSAFGVLQQVVGRQRTALQDAYDAQAKKLAEMFRTNFEKFGSLVSDKVKEAGPRG